MELGVHLQQHFQACMKRLAGDALEVGTHQHPHAAPAFGRRPRHGRNAVGVFLHKLHVAMPATLAHLRQLGLHPVVAGQGQLDGLADKGVKLKEREIPTPPSLREEA